jgi:hypothetical protein
MELKTVDSSMIHAVGYDEADRTMEVVFNSGKRYFYHNVPKEEYEGLLAAESKGRCLLDHILDCYPYELGRRRRR